MGGPGSGRKKASADCELRFRGEHYTKRTRMVGKIRPKIMIITEPTRVDENGIPEWLCPLKWNEDDGFLTCAEAKARKICTFKKKRADNLTQEKKSLENNLRVYYGLEPLEAES